MLHTVSDSNHPPAGEESYMRILSVSPRDARLYVWSESIVLLAGIGLVIALLLAISLPFLDVMHGSWRGLRHYIGGVFVLPLPFLAVLLVGVRLHRRVARRHGLLSE